VRLLKILQTAILLLLACYMASADILVVSANANAIFRYDQNSGAFLQKFDSSSVQYPYGLAFGPDGFLYLATSDAGSGSNSHIDRFDPATGHLLASFGALPQTRGLAIGPDGLVYVSAFNARQVWRYTTAGVFVDVVATVVAPYSLALDFANNLYVNNGSGTIYKVDASTHATSTFVSDPNLVSYNNEAMAFGPDGNLYLGTSPFSAYAHQVRRYNGQTGAFGTVFAQDSRIDEATSLAFGSDGKVYVGTFSGTVLRFDQITSAFIDVFVPSGSGGLGGNITAVLFSPPSNAKPVVIVVPGFGASTLEDSFGNDQWLSCTSILNLHNGFLGPLQYTTNGSAVLALTPREILAQGDSISETVKLSNQSVLQCSTYDANGNPSDLITDVVCTTGWLNCGKVLLFRPSRQQIQMGIVDNAHGALLQFNTILSTLADNNFTTDPWKYDFRRDISALADDLYAHVVATHPGQNIAIITHSQGTLITAALIQQHPDLYNSGLLTAVISMGPPFAGSIDTYLYAQGWRSFLPFLSTSNTKLMGQNWTSVYELLPQWDFVTRLSAPFPTKYDIFSGQNDAKNFPALPRASIIPNSSDATSLWSKLNSLGPVARWYSVIGQGQRTANQIVEKLTLGTYKPCLTIDEEDGDGTVPLSSAEASLIVPPSNRIYVQDQHSHLPQNTSVIQGIINLLSRTSPYSVAGLSQSPLAFSSPDTIVLNACSPVSLTVSDSLGNIVNSQFSQIQNATFANIGDATQIDLPWNDTFQVQISGTGTGTFDLLVNGIRNQQTNLSYFFRAVPVQKGSQGAVIISDSIPTLQYNYAGKDIVDTIPANTVPPTVICTGCYFTTQNLRATFAFNVGYPGGVSTFSYNYRSSIQSVQLISSKITQITISGNTATFSGQGAVNGQLGYNFTVSTTDGGPAGSGLDTIVIQITGPNGYTYSINSFVIGGDVIVHP